MTRNDLEKILDITTFMIKKERENAERYIKLNPQDKGWRNNLANERIDSLNAEWLAIKEQYMDVWKEAK